MSFKERELYGKHIACICQNQHTIKRKRGSRYVAFYLVDNGKQLVTVVRIFYGGRDLQNLI